MPRAWSCLNFDSHECTFELLEASRENHCKHLKTQSSTYLSPDLLCQYTIELVELSIAFTSIPLNWLQKQGHTHVLVGERATLIDKDTSVTLSSFGRGPRWKCDPSVLETRLLSGLETQLSWNAEVTLDAFGRECRVKCIWNVSSVLDACLAQIELEIRATNLGY